MSERFDLCVIGAGTAGFAAAEAARAAGRTVVVISAPGDLGGACIRRGCMPAKTVLSSTEALVRVERADRLGVEAAQVHADPAAIVARKRELVDYFVDDRTTAFKAHRVYHGLARFVSDDAIDVDERRIEAERFVIATGSHVLAPDIPGLNEAGYITSTEALEITVIPAAIVVIGAGPVGCEFAQYFARLGARVTLVQHEDEILRNEDHDLAAVLRRALELEGVTVALNAHVEHIRGATGEVHVTIADAATTRTVTATCIMLAAERRPNIAGLDLAAAGVRVEGDVIVLDEFLRTSNARVFAAGDVIGRRELVHVAEWAGTLAANNAFADVPTVADFERLETHAVFTQPQIAVTGLTERVAKERGVTVRVARHPFRDLGKALVSDEARGFVKMIADDSGLVVGVGIVGDDSIDLINEATVIIARGMTIAEVAALPHLHPTMGEIYVRVAEDLMSGVEAGA